jgi:hypothetical protein
MEDKVTANMLDDLTQAYLNSMFSYDPLTGRLTAKVKSGRFVPGKEVGSVKGGGYRQVRISGKTYLVHRVIWCMVYGNFPAKRVDHKDRNRLNNSISNLRVVTAIGNATNRSGRVESKTGIKGVCWHSRVQRWYVQIRSEGRVVYRSYYDDLSVAESVAVREYAKLGVS